MKLRTLTHPKVSPAARLAKPKPPTVKFQATAYLDVQVDFALGNAGIQFAQQVAPLLAPLYDQLLTFFAAATRPHLTCIISALSPGHDGTGGAYHMNCSDTTLVCDAAFGNPELTAALFVAEAVEVLEAQQGTGWSCGDTNGEALSRALAEALCPGVLDSFATAAAWLDTPSRPDFINNQQGTDTDVVSVGCGVLFLNWLHTACGKAWPAIVAAAGPTLADTYVKLGLGNSPYADFRTAVDARWPVGQPSGVLTDNPWAAELSPAVARLQVSLPAQLVLPGGGRIALSLALAALQQLLPLLLQALEKPAVPATAGR